MFVKEIAASVFVLASMLAPHEATATPLNPMRTADGQAAAGDYAAAFTNLKGPLLSDDFVDKSVAAGVLRRHTKILTEGLRINAQAIADTSDCSSAKKLVDESMALVLGFINEVPPENRMPVVIDMEAIAGNVKPGACRDSAKGIGSVATAVKVRATEAERLALEKAEEEEKAKAAARDKASAMMARLEATGKIIRDINVIGEKAAYSCNNASHCSKAFAIAQIFLSENVPMKIESSNDTIVSTYQPIRDQHFHAKVVKIPKRGTKSEVRLTLTCRSDIKSEQDLLQCHAGRKVAYEKFLSYMKANVQL